MSTCSIFELETSFWCQKFCLDLLSSEHVSGNFLEVGNLLKIDLERLATLYGGTVVRTRQFSVQVVKSSTLKALEVT
jgi:hypothetical protein